MSDKKLSGNNLSEDFTEEVKQGLFDINDDQALSDDPNDAENQAWLKKFDANKPKFIDVQGQPVMMDTNINNVSGLAPKSADKLNFVDIQGQPLRMDTALANVPGFCIEPD